jgi:hypothetical protein
MRVIIILVNKHNLSVEMCPIFVIFCGYCADHELRESLINNKLLYKTIYKLPCMINSDVRDMINRIVKLKKSYGSINIKRNIITVYNEYKEYGRKYSKLYKKLMCTVIRKYKTKIILDHISSFNIISNKYQLIDRECIFPSKGMIMFKTCFGYMANVSYSMKYQSNILFRILEKKNIVSCSDVYKINDLRKRILYICKM